MQAESNQHPDKHIVLTGATGGIGQAAAAQLAATGAQLHLVGRNADKLTDLQNQVRQQSGNPNLFTYVADLAHQDEIHRLAEELNAALPRLDVLLNNAATFTPRCTTSPDGFELQYAVNQLSYVLLTERLLDKLRASAPARIVNTGSEAHRWAKDIDSSDRHCAGHYRPLRAYARTKAMNNLFSFRLARELPAAEVSVNVVHPGGVATNLGNQHGGTMGFLWRLGKPLMIPPKRGGANLVHAALAPELAGVSGAYFYQKQRRQPSALTTDASLQDQCWAMCRADLGLPETR